MEEETKVEVKGNEIEVNPDSKFCPFCGKNRKGQDFKPCVIGSTHQFTIKVSACKSCNVVFHNARRIFNDVVNKMVDQSKQQQLAKEAISNRLKP